ncbi:hypothetical protein Tco_1045949 [Tanacetum coccineum]
MANLFPNDDANALVPNFNIEFVPNPGHAHFANNNNNNGWIEWDVPLGEMDEPMVDSESDEEEMCVKESAHARNMCLFTVGALDKIDMDVTSNMYGLQVVNFVLYEDCYAKVMAIFDL